VVSTTPRPFYPLVRPGTHYTGGWVGPGAIWTCAKSLARTGIRSPDRPARSQSLYRLSYRDPQRKRYSYNLFPSWTFVDCCKVDFVRLISLCEAVDISCARGLHFLRQTELTAVIRCYCTLAQTADIQGVAWCGGLC
jgi:hypothetical protein